MRKRLTQTGDFAAFTGLYALKSCGGRAAFLAKRPSLGRDKYDIALWLLGPEGCARAEACGAVARFWWKDGETLWFAPQKVPGAPPGTRLMAWGAAGGEAPREVCRLARDAEEILFLPGGGFLYLALWDPAWEAALAGGGGPAAARRRYEQESRVKVADELPVWENGAGFAAGTRRRLYRWAPGGCEALTPPGLDVEEARLAPDGRSVFFTGRLRKAVTPFGGGLWRLDLESGACADISPFAAFRYDGFDFLEDGALVLCGSDMKRHGVNQNSAFYRYVPGKGAPETLYDEGAFGFGDTVVGDIKTGGEARLLARKGFVYWVGTGQKGSALLRLGLADGRVEALTPGLGAVQGFAFAGARPLVIGMAGLLGQEVYALAPGAGAAAPLSDLNRAPGEKIAFARPLPLSFVNEEGSIIEGWVLPPAGLCGEKRYPAVLAVHGGPKAAHGEGLFHEYQLLAAAGYGVLFCNPTGSDGGGDGFGDLRGRYGQVDYRDLMAFVNAACAAHGWIDPGRLGISGGSYGGFMVNWAVAQTGRFKAAVCQRGIANWHTMLHTSDIGYFLMPDQIGEEALWARSPLRLAGRVKTPTLFIHSGEDYRCPVGESVQMYTALQMRGVKTRLCVFSGENHDLSRSGRPSLRKRRLEEILKWFGEYL